MTKLNAKLMNEKLKKGWVAADFAEYLSTTEELFIQAVKETFSGSAAKGMLSALKRNEKRKKQSSTHSEDESNFLPLDAQNIETEEQENSVTYFQEDISRNLILKLEALSQELCEKEITHKNLISDRQKLFASLQEYREKMFAMRKEIEKYQAEISEIADSISSITDEMKKVNSEIKTMRDKKSEIEGKIQELSKLNIYVYESGDIEIEGETALEIPESWISLSQELTLNPELECLTIKQIKQLAKLLVLEAALNSQGKSFEFTFESEIVQKHFFELQMP